MICDQKTLPSTKIFILGLTLNSRVFNALNRLPLTEFEN